MFLCLLFVLRVQLFISALWGSGDVKGVVSVGDVTDPRWVF